MTADPKTVEAMYWTEDPSWYRVNKEKNCFELTDKASERARKSFELYCKKNKKNSA